MTLAIVIFMGAALAMAGFLILSSLRTSREEQRAIILAQEREHTARQDAQKAREARARWEAKVAQEQLLAAASDPRGIGDGLGRFERSAPARTGRFTRERAVPLPSGRDRG